MKNIITKISVVAISLMTVLAPVAFAIENPLKGGDSISGLINLVMTFIVRVGGIVAVFMFIYTGFTFVTAQGNESKLTTAKNMFFGTCIGVAVLLGAQLIASIVIGTIKGVV